ncbi:hypothetical protein G6F35_019202 [Rhizopus arrhizus]|nr:hypothetical protein G6F35_019202 [Rhizopus arrhizus]
MRCPKRSAARCATMAVATPTTACSGPYSAPVAAPLMTNSARPSIAISAASMRSRMPSARPRRPASAAAGRG